MSAKKKYPSKPGALIIRPWSTHWRTGKRIYPKNGRFLAFVSKKKSA